MEPDDHICLCHRVSQRKLVNFMRREEPRVPSQLSECLGAGTGCQWCVPYLTDLFEQWKAGGTPVIPGPPDEYAQGRAKYRLERRRPRITPADDFPDAGPANLE